MSESLPIPDDPDYGQDDQMHDSDFSDDVDESESPLADRYSDPRKVFKETQSIEEGQE